MTTTKITFRSAKRFGNTAAWTALVEGKSTGITIVQQPFDYSNRCEQYSVLDRSMRDERFTTKRDAALAALAAGLGVQS